MIYLDSAATTLQKPRSVERAMMHAMRTMASPGRGGHEPAMKAADIAFACRQALADLFHVDAPENIIFTMNATHALNIAIHSLVQKGDKVVISGYEHNSVTRPLTAKGADVIVARSPLFDTDACITAFRKALPGAKCAVCCHTSNVFGYILPLNEISNLCKEYHVPLIVDASQSAGAVPIDFTALDAEYLAMPGHKGLYGPQGTGVLICKTSAQPLLYGGTGSLSLEPYMPEELPDRLEAGTHNITGIAGLYAGVQYVAAQKPERILQHEKKLMQQMLGALRNLSGVTVYADEHDVCQAGVLSVLVKDKGCEQIAAELGTRGIAVRAGLHCAPTAHETAGTISTGTVRFSFSAFNTPKEIQKAAMVFSDLVKKM